MRSLMYRTKLRCQTGSILLTSCIAVAIVAIMIMGMLTYISEEYKLNVRSHKWNQTLNLAEAGVEMAFAEFNNYYMAGTNAFTSSRGWSDYGGGSYVRYVSYNNVYGEYV